MMEKNVPEYSDKIDSIACGFILYYLLTGVSFILELDLK